MSLKSDRSQIHRLPARGHYDRDTVYAILDRNSLCHVSFVLDGSARIIPTAYGRDGEWIYLHGSAKSSMLAHLASGAECAIAVTQVEGIVLARSLFHSSMNYHSVVVYGRGEEVTAREAKMEALRIVSESIWPGRWDAARLPDDGELKATMVVRVLIADGAAKIRTGPAKDNAEDYALDIWAGVIPVETRYGAPLSDDRLAADTNIPQHVQERIGTKP